MLYDQAQLVLAYANAFLITKKSSFADVVKDILAYVSRDLSHKVSDYRKYYLDNFRLASRKCVTSVVVSAIYSKCVA